MFLILIALVLAIWLPHTPAVALLLLPKALGRSWRGWQPDSALAWLLFVWLLWVAGSLLLSPMPGASLTMASVFLALPLAWLAGSNLSERDQFKAFLDFITPALLVVMVLWGLIQGPDNLTQKAQGPFNDPNTYAALLNMLALPLWAAYLNNDPAQEAQWLRACRLALIGGTALTFFLVASRGASVALIAAAVPLLWMARGHPHLPRKLINLGATLFSAYLFALAVSGDANVAQRLINTVARGGDSSRMMLYESTWLMIRDHFWLGVGFGGFRMQYPLYRMLEENETGGGWVHNDYLQAWAEGGLPMFLLLAGLWLWIVTKGWRLARQGGGHALMEMGFLMGIFSCLLQAALNFILYFTLFSMLLGLYLARLSPASREDWPRNRENLRPWRLATGAYVFIVGWMLLADLMVDTLLVHAQSARIALFRAGWYLSPYQTARWLSIATPFHPTPQLVMGKEFAETYLLFGGDEKMAHAALDNMDAAWRAAPCYLPFGNQSLAYVAQFPVSADLHERGKRIALRNLDCDPRHGLSYFMAGHFSTTPEERLMWWRAGLMASVHRSEELLLVTTLLAEKRPEHRKILGPLSWRMAEAIRNQETDPALLTDQVFWADAQALLYHLVGPTLNEMVRLPK